jgi:Uma2 family endonuclease
MSEHYEEILEGESFIRQPPGPRHERVLQKLHQALSSEVSQIPNLTILPLRSVMQISAGSMVRPDLCLVASINNKLALAIEVIDSVDHRIDTVEKKELYDANRIPRLWIVDPRYDNIEVYQGSPHGLRLTEILAGREALEEPLLPGFKLVARELFAE